MRSMKEYLYQMLLEINSMTLQHRTIMSLLLVAVAACSKGGDPVLEEFSGRNIHYISPIDSVKLDEYGIFMPEFVVKHRDKFIIKKHDNVNFIDILDLTKGEIIKIAKKGRAFNEYINIGSIQYDKGNLRVYDLSLQKYNIYNLDSTILNGDESLMTHQYQFKQTPLGYIEKPFKIYHNYDKYIAVGLWENDCWYRLMNKDGLLLGGVEKIVFDELETMADIEIATLHLSSCVSIKPSGDKVVCALCNAPAISVSEIREDKLVETKRVVFNSPQVNGVNQKGMPLLQYSGNNLKTFCNLYSTEKHIYALYSGKSMNSTTPSYQCNYLLVYDWDLEPIKLYELDDSINSCYIEEDTLYGVSSYPESRLYVFYLND